MMDEPLAKERLAADLRPLISAAVWRTALIAGSSDQSLSVTFAEPIAEGTRQGTALMKQIGDRVSTPDEKAAFASITEHRNNYQAAKKLIMDAKKSGDAAEGARVYKDVFEPEANRYQASVSDLVKLQRKAIDDSALAIAGDNERSLRLAAALCALMVGFGGVCAWVISRSITRPLQVAVDVAAKVANGDLTTAFSAQGKDEVGDLMRALETMNGAWSRTCRAAPAPSPGHRAKLPPATSTCRCAPSSKPARSKKPLPRWKN